MTLPRMPSKDYVAKFRLAELLDEAANECYLAQSQDPCGFFVNHFTLRGGMNVIDNITAREILDASLTPTLEVEVHANGRVQSCVAASQCTTFHHPAPLCVSVANRDNDDFRYNGLGQRNAVQLIHNYLAPKMIGLQLRQSVCDNELRVIDGTKNNAKLGVHTVAAVSASIAIACGNVSNRPPFLPLAEEYYMGGLLPKKFFLPTPVISALNPNVQAFGKIRLREVVILPNPLEYVKISDGLAVCAKVIKSLGKILVTKFGEGADSIGVEGGYMFSGYESVDQAVALVEESIKDAGYTVGRVVQIGLYIDGDMIYSADTQKYHLIDGVDYIGAQISEVLVKLVTEHPGITYLEDTHHSTDYTEFKRVVTKLGPQNVAVVGGRMYSTLEELSSKGASDVQSTVCMLRLNDVGTVTELFRCARSFVKGLKGGAVAVTGEVQECAPTLLADLAVAIGARYLRAGGYLRGEKVATLNRLIHLQEYLEKHEIFSQQPTLDPIDFPAPPPEVVAVVEPVASKIDKGKKK